MICKHCNEENKSDSVFCKHCGKLLTESSFTEGKLKQVFCSNCGAKLEDDAVFCTKCGTPVEIISDFVKSNSVSISEPPVTSNFMEFVESAVKEIYICENCGYEFDCEKVFCDSCGTKLTLKNEKIEIKEEVKVPAEENRTEDFCMVIDYAFDITNVGVVVDGIVQNPDIKKNDTVYLIRKNGSVIKSKVKDMKERQDGILVDVTSVNKGSNVAIALENVKIQEVEKGDVISLTPDMMHPDSKNEVENDHIQEIPSASGREIVSFGFATKYKGKPAVGLSEGSGSLVLYDDRIEFKRKFNAFGGFAITKTEPVVYLYDEIKSYEETKYIGIMPAIVLVLKNGQTVSFVNSMGISDEKKELVFDTLRKYVK